MRLGLRLLFFLAVGQGLSDLATAQAQTGDPTTIILTGPSSLVRCVDAVFQWSGGVPPYQLYTTVPTLTPGGNFGALSNSTETSGTTLAVPITEPAGATINFAVWDSNRVKSNDISLVVQGSTGDCVFTTSATVTFSTTSVSTVTLPSSTPVPTLSGSAPNTLPTSGGDASTDSTGTPPATGTPQPTGSAGGPPLTTAVPSSNKDAGTMSGSTIGITVMSVILGIGFIAFVILWCIRRKNRSKKQESMGDSPWEKNNKADGKKGAWIQFINLNNATDVNDATNRPSSSDTGNPGNLGNSSGGSTPLVVDTSARTLEMRRFSIDPSPVTASLNTNINVNASTPATATFGSAPALVPSPTGLATSQPSPNYNSSLLTPVTPSLLPSSKQLRMMREQQRHQRHDSMRDSLGHTGSHLTSSGDYSSYQNSASLFYTEQNRSPQQSPQSEDQDHRRRRSSQLQPIVERFPQSLQAIISRELEHILQHDQTSPPISDLASPNGEPLEKSRPLGDSDVSRRPGALTPSNTNQSGSSVYSPDGTIASSTTAPAMLSRQDMELLADMVAARLIRDRVVNPPGSTAGDAPPPSYS